jgi:hypothetical protein
MGCIRSSNEFDFPNFHFRIIVQIIAVPPTTEAITIRTVVVVFCMAAFFFVTSLGAAEAAASTELVTRTTLGVEEVTGGVLMIDVVGRREGVDEMIDVVDEADDVLRTLLLDDNGVLLTTLSRTLVDEAEGEDVGGGLGLSEGVTDGSGGTTGVDGGAGVLDDCGAGLDEAGGGLPPAPTTGPMTVAWGPRFLIRRFRLLWSRRAGWAYPFA